MSVDLVQILVALDLLRRVLRILRGRGYEIVDTHRASVGSGSARLELTRGQAAVGIEALERELARGELDAEDRAAFVEVAAAFRAALGPAYPAETADELELVARAATRCRVCGCTDDDCNGCIARTGRPCHWIEPDLCSACEGRS